jgi:hypothetical protein
VPMRQHRAPFCFSWAEFVLGLLKRSRFWWAALLQTKPDGPKRIQIGPTPRVRCRLWLLYGGQVAFSARARPGEDALPPLRLLLPPRTRSLPASCRHHHQEGDHIGSSFTSKTIHINTYDDQLFLLYVETLILLSGQCQWYQLCPYEDSSHFAAGAFVWSSQRRRLVGKAVPFSICIVRL